MEEQNKQTDGESNVKAGKSASEQKQTSEKYVSEQPPGWITTLREHAAEGKDWVVVSGFEGGVIDDKSIRIYLDTILWRAIEIPIEAILHTESIKEGLEGATHVWIDRARWGECLYRVRA